MRPRICPRSSASTLCPSLLLPPPVCARTKNRYDVLRLFRRFTSPLPSQYRPSTPSRTAIARIATLRRRSMSLLQHVRVIVRQLLPGLDIANRLDPDTAVLDHSIAVRIA